MAIELDDRAKALENEFFRRKEQELIEKMRAKIREANPGTTNCPKCDGTLVETDYDNIKIDVCDKCHGVWLDAGELTQIVHHDADKGWMGRLFG